MLKKLIRAARYLAATARVYSLEAELAERDKLGALVTDPATLSAMHYRREAISQDLARARAEWQTFYPPGVRFTWGQA
jgi:hypothetical protein